MLISERGLGLFTVCIIWLEVFSGSCVSVDATVVTWKRDIHHYPQPKYVRNSISHIISTLLSPASSSWVIPDGSLQSQACVCFFLISDVSLLFKYFNVSFSPPRHVPAASTCPAPSPSLYTVTATCARVWRSPNTSLCSDWARSTWALPSRAPAPYKVWLAEFCTVELICCFYLCERLAQVHFLLSSL